MRKTRKELGVSQPAFADFLGTSPSTVRSWEQGQKVPSPMARRILGLIGADPAYWKSRFASMVEPQGSEHALSVVADEAGAGYVRDRAEAYQSAGAEPSQETPPRRRQAIIDDRDEKAPERPAFPSLHFRAFRG